MGGFLKNGRIRTGLLKKCLKMFQLSLLVLSREIFVPCLSRLLILLALKLPKKKSFSIVAY